MYINESIFKKEWVVLSISALILLFLGGCGITGPSVEARPQTISFGAAPQLALGGSATVTATASSGLAISYSSTTPNVCSVDVGTGIVTDLIGGTCTIAANQSGNTTFAPAAQVTQSITVNFDPNQTISFGAVPTLSFGGIARVTATASSGLAVRYSSTTPTACTVDSTTGLVTDLTVGTCSIAADQPGDTYFNPAPQVTQAITVSAVTDAVTTYNVVTTFLEPDTQPKNTIFVGTFTLNAATGSVSNLHGILSESMTGGAFAYPNDTMNWLSLNNQLSSVPVKLDGVDGLLVTTFLLTTTTTFSVNPNFGGTDGWSPGTGFGLYYGFPGANPGNAYVRIFVNLSNPTALLTQLQIDQLAYADCTASGMMGGTCMTGTTVAGYGTIGSMSGHPVSQIITKKP
jgi:hypothetical protein